jgi:hypothetical protein
MWVVRELLRLLWSIVVAATIAAVLAIVIALAHGGDFTHELKISFLCVGCLMLLLSMGGNRNSAGNRRMNAGIDHSATFVMRIPGVPPETEGPTLTASAVFVGTAVALFVLAFSV